MKIKIIGIEKCLDDNQKITVRIIVKSNTQILNVSINNQMEKFSISQILNGVSEKLKVSESDIIIPQHIRCKLSERS